MKLICPKCSGNSLYYTEHNALKYCFKCGHTERGKDYKPPKRYEDIKGIREVYTHLTEWYHDALDTEHITYLESRGITQDMIRTYKIGFIPESIHPLYEYEISRHAGLLDKHGNPFLKNRIVFPYYVDGVVTDLRARSLTGSNEYKYLSPKGTGYYRGADYPFNYDRIFQSDTIVITEGDPKAIMSDFVAQIPTVSIPGIRAIRPALQRHRNKKFIACFDTQVNNWYDVVSAIYKLSEWFTDLFVAVLPLRGQKKQDIDSFILQYGVERYQRVIQSALPFDNWRKLVRV